MNVSYVYSHLSRELQIKCCKRLLMFPEGSLVEHHLVQ